MRAREGDGERGMERERERERMHAVQETGYSHPGYLGM